MCGAGVRVMPGTGGGVDGIVQLRTWEGGWGVVTGSGGILAKGRGCWSKKEGEGRRLAGWIFD